MKTDIQIRKDVIAELDFDPRLDAEAIGVTVEHGVVTLTGHVPNYAQKVAAENAAKRVSRVRGVAQDIEVRFAASSPHDDTEIAERAANILSWNVFQPKDGVKVRVEKGWVTLRGEVTWNYQRADAESAIRRLTGVIGVSNLITVRANVAPNDIKRRITTALHRNAQLDATSVDVVVEGGKVTLNGKVRSLVDRDIAETAAWATPGVMQVTDNILVQ